MPAVKHLPDEVKQRYKVQSEQTPLELLVFSICWENLVPPQYLIALIPLNPRPE